MLEQWQTWVRGVFGKVFHRGEVKRALQVELALSSAMEEAVTLWSDMFREAAPWLNSNTQSLGLPAAIAGELARLVTVELASSVQGSARADYLQSCYASVMDKLRVHVELAIAGGGLVLKPYWDGTGLTVDCVPAWRFAPISVNGRGDLTGAVFHEQLQRGTRIYTRLEKHTLIKEGYSITNHAFCSHTAGVLGTPCSLSTVPEWADLLPETTIARKDGSAVEGMLFAHFKLPFANTIDGDSPLGVSAFSRAVGLIEEADKQYSRILWEYEGSELAIDTTMGAIQKDAVSLPARRRRLFRGLNLDGGSNGDLYKVFNPDIRDTSLFHGLDQLLKRIEFNCYLSYGTISDPQTVEKTAEEIKGSKQRSYSAVCDIQKALQKSLEQLVWVLDFYASLYRLAPPGAYETSFTWGDGILENTELEFARRKQLADSGYLRPELLLSWYFGVSEEEAKAYLPRDAPPLFGEE